MNENVSCGGSVLWKAEVKLTIEYLGSHYYFVYIVQFFIFYFL